MAAKKEETKFSKEVLLNSKRFANRKDALNVILADGDEYTIDEVETRLDEFMKGMVK